MALLFFVVLGFFSNLIAAIYFYTHGHPSWHVVSSGSFAFFCGALLIGAVQAAAGGSWKDTKPISCLATIALILGILESIFQINLW
jgi:hypothetical protein